MADVVNIADRMDEKAEISLLGAFRSLASDFAGRAWIATKSGLSFHGKRDLYHALGYPSQISCEQYRLMFERNGIAERVVAAMPESTWRGGGELIEDEKTQTQTKFEKAFDDLNRRLKLWSVFQRADILAGVNRYSIIVLGAPGKPDTPLERMTSSDQLFYTTIRSEEEAEILSLEEDLMNPRYGQPQMYRLRRAAGIKTTAATDVHWSRVIHVWTDGYGIPRLQKVYNWCQDLEKVAGGGSEAFWLRANQGLQLDLDKEVKITPGSVEEKELRAQVDEYVHKMRRVLRTRGIKATVLGSDVADFRSPVLALISLIAGSAKIPQRILLGSERGELSSTQDRFNWDNRIRDRRLEYAGPFVVRQFVDRCIAVGILPSPAQYDVRWPEIKNLDDVQRADVALKYARVNEANKSVVITEDEIRDRILELPPLTPEQLARSQQRQAQPAPSAGDSSSSSNPNPQQDPAQQGA
jgi:hypothetical protein